MTTTAAVNPFVSFPAGDTPPSPAANHTIWWGEDLAGSDGDDFTGSDAWTPYVDDIGFGDYTLNVSGVGTTKIEDNVIGTRRSLQQSTDASRSLISDAVTLLSQPITRVAVAIFPSESGVNYLLGGSGTNRCALSDLNTGTYKTWSGGTLSSGVSQNASAHLFVCVFNGASSSLDIDGTQYTGDAGTNGIAQAEMFSTASDASAATGGTVAFEMIVDGTLTSGELSDLETWVSDYYGITI